MEEIKLILSDINISNLNNINIVEIGTGFGTNSTKIIYEYFNSQKKPFIINSYEGCSNTFNVAKKNWDNFNNVDIINEYVTNKGDIKNVLIPNIPKYIEDYKETNERFIQKYLKLFNNNDNYIASFNIIPDIIFIDCSRFMHLPIIKKCYEINNNKNTIYIIEDDYFINNNYGELEIIENHFILKNIKKYKKNKWQWPFVSFQIESTI